MLLAEFKNLFIEASFKIFLAHLADKFRFFDRLYGVLLSVCEHDVHLVDIISRLAIAQTFLPAGVVGNHTTDRAEIAAGWITR